MLKEISSKYVTLAILIFGTPLSVHANCVIEPLHAQEEDCYRSYNDSTPEHVKNFYKLNHTYQTVEFVLEKKAEFCNLKRQKMNIWEAINRLNQLVDESDPDIDLPQSYHFYQTAEAIRRDGHPRWFILAGFIHDLGKILATYGEPQWAVVGDTFPVGCAYSEKIVFSDYFQSNPDAQNTRYQTALGIYASGCGFGQLHMSWGHDEYLYQVVKDYLPPEAAYIIRFHSFYAAHREGAYRYFMDDMDHQMMPWLQLFSRYDLYSKSSEKLNIEALETYYQGLVNEFFPDDIAW